MRSNYCQRTRGDETEGLPVTEGGTGSWPIKPKMKTLVVGLGPCWLQQKLLVLKIPACICLSKANVFSEHL